MILSVKVLCRNNAFYARILHPNPIWYTQIRSINLNSTNLSREAISSIEPLCNFRLFHQAPNFRNESKVSFGMRLRFAPSPTGNLHLGGLRTAVYNYLLAKRYDGHVYLRFEDTDRSRLVPGSMESMFELLRYSGMVFDDNETDGGICHNISQVPKQSERNEIYAQHARKLLDEGKAYKCFCTPERLESIRRRELSRGKPPSYDRHCRWLSPDQIDHLENHMGLPYTIRLKVPTKLDYQNEKIDETGNYWWKTAKSPTENQLHTQLPWNVITINDLVHGEVKFNFNNVDDQILLKSSDLPDNSSKNLKNLRIPQPTYHLSNVVDDHWMGITHVVRGKEWLNSTAKHILLYRAFGWKEPKFAHLPLLLNPDGTKLSKRSEQVSNKLDSKVTRLEGSVEHYYEQRGFYPEALMNFLIYLGWSDPETKQTDHHLRGYQAANLPLMFSRSLKHSGANEAGDRPASFLESAAKQFSLEGLRKSSGVRVQSEQLEKLNQRYLKQFIEHDRPGIRIELERELEQAIMQETQRNRNHSRAVSSLEKSFEISRVGIAKKLAKILLTESPISLQQSKPNQHDQSTSTSSFDCMLERMLCMRFGKNDCHINPKAQISSARDVARVIARDYLLPFPSLQAIHDKIPWSRSEWKQFFQQISPLLSSSKSAITDDKITILQTRLCKQQKKALRWALTGQLAGIPLGDCIKLLNASEGLLKARLEYARQTVLNDNYQQQ